MILETASLITSVVGVASMVASVTPTKSDDKIMKKVRKYTNFLAFNFGRAKNRD